MNPRGTWTLFYKEIARFKEVWMQTILAPLISNLLFLLVFGLTLSKEASPVPGFAYLTFLIPGLAAMGAMSNAIQNPMSSLIIAKYTNNIQELLMIPLRGYEISLAYIGAGIVRGFLVAASTVLVGMIFTPVPFSNPALIIIFLTLLGGIFSSVGAIIGIVAKEFDGASIIPTFILTPLMYLGGVFYSINHLPGIFASLSKFNPIYYMIDGFRHAFLGTSEISVSLSLGITVLCFVATFGIASAMFQKGYRLKT